MQIGVLGGAAELCLMTVQLRILVIVHVLSGLPGLVSFEADAQACRAGVIKRHLKHELLLTALRNKASHMGQLVLLGARGRVMEVERERHRLGRGNGGNRNAISRLQASIFDSGSTCQNVFDQNRTRTVDGRISGYYGLEHRFGFDGGRRWFGLGHPRAAVWTGIVSNQLTNKTLLIALSVGGGNYFQADNLGAHRLAEHFLSSEREKETEK
ncbi:hypothetical protein F7725_001767 [Dissostichus mawsoni]|uniref:Uncharacterized protein n=1 Tax=Dissostichus mawsoni TaxID=36200 RepID=A0A7J5Y3K3_DISMA|nr:hypothetical protein F7725_001767 [Dissostichus mawsoni]